METSEFSQAPLLSDKHNDPVQGKTYETFESEPTDMNGNESIRSQAHLFCDVYNDREEDMTYGRLVARYLTNKYSWYFPGKAKLDEYELKKKDISEPQESPPSLDSAWSYFEHFVLPRYNVRTDDNSDEHRNERDELERSAPGSTKETRLYPVIKTSAADLADLGEGVGLYFILLKACTVILFLAGCINILHMSYFSSNNYVSDAQQSIFKNALKGMLCTFLIAEAVVVSFIARKFSFEIYFRDHFSFPYFFYKSSYFSLSYVNIQMNHLIQALLFALTQLGNLAQLVNTLTGTLLMGVIGAMLKAHQILRSSSSWSITAKSTRILEC